MSKAINNAVTLLATTGALFSVFPTKASTKQKARWSKIDNGNITNFEAPAEYAYYTGSDVPEEGRGIRVDVDGVSVPLEFSISLATPAAGQAIKAGAKLQGVISATAMTEGSTTQWGNNIVLYANKNFSETPEAGSSNYPKYDGSLTIGSGKDRQELRIALWADRKETANGRLYGRLSFPQAATSDTGASTQAAPAAPEAPEFDDVPF